MASKYSKLTKEMAFDLCEKLWARLAETGEQQKGIALEAISHSKYFFRYDCPMCEFVQQQHGIIPDAHNCRKYCPLVIATKHNCYALGYNQWENKTFGGYSTEESKKAAKKFYNNILPILKGEIK